MKGAPIAILVWISLTLGCSCRQETHIPAPDAPDAPTFEPQAKKPAVPAASKPAVPAAAKPAQPAAPPLSSLPASREPPIYGLPLAIKIKVPEVPKELAQPSPPRDEKKAQP